MMNNTDSQGPSGEDIKLRYKESLSQLCLVTRMNQAVTLLEDLPALCISIVTAIIEFTPAENCSIMLSDPKNGALSLFVAKGRSDGGSFFGGEGFSFRGFSRGEGIAGWVAEHEEAVFIDDCEVDERFIKLENASKEIRSVVCAPVIFQGAVMGVINCSHSKKHRFSAIDKRNVTLVADQTAIVLERALAIDRMRKECEDLKTKLTDGMDRLSETEKNVAELKDQIYKSEKFTTLGELLAGVAHELNNRIAPILIYSQMLQQETGDERSKKRLHVVEESAMGAKAILETLLNYSRPGTQEREAVNLNQVLQNTLTLVEYKLRNHGVELVTDLCAHLPPAVVNEKQFAQIFLNIINNAIHAMEPNGGALRIRSTHDHNCVKFVISDSGPGVPEEISEKIFEPFFTTKESGKGTGLGLSISKRYAEEHGGRIYLESSSPQGATFIMEIPNADQRKETSHEPQHHTNCSGGAAKILVVEDDSTIRDVIRDVLGNGYHVDFANDGHAATDKIENDCFDALVVDYHMPGLDGKQLYQWVLSNRPVLKGRIIFSTGDIYRDEVRNFIESTGCRFLVKPFSTSKLRELVSGVLNG
ncbi:response regulator [Candidatus Poribacteria bacterium]|nr:response regulator [Candidatus Poribacteria bacterium]